MSDNNEQQTGITREQLALQLGRVESKLDGIVDRAAEMREEMRAARSESTKDRENIWSELRNVKHEARNEMQVLSLRMEKQESRMETLQQTVSRMDAPLQTVVTFQRRVSAIIAAAISIGSVLWVIRDPIWASVQWFVKFATGAAVK